MRLDAKKAIGAESTPDEDGARLGTYIVENNLGVTVSEIDVRELAPEDLVSSFVNAMLHVLSTAGVAVKRFKNVKWLAKFESEGVMLGELTSLFLTRPITQPEIPRKRADRARPS